MAHDYPTFFFPDLLAYRYSQGTNFWPITHEWMSPVTFEVMFLKGSYFLFLSLPPPLSPGNCYRDMVVTSQFSASGWEWPLKKGVKKEKQSRSQMTLSGRAFIPSWTAYQPRILQEREKSVSSYLSQCILPQNCRVNILVYYFLCLLFWLLNISVNHHWAINILYELRI